MFLEARFLTALCAWGDPDSPCHLADLWQCLHRRKEKLFRWDLNCFQTVVQLVEDLEKSEDAIFHDAEASVHMDD